MTAARGSFPGGEFTVQADDDATRRRAALYVAGAARDADDARLLLTALGLIDVPMRRKKTAPPTTTTSDCPINTRTRRDP